MKETPLEKKIHNNMKAAVMSINGFLGKDNRHFHEIVEKDCAILEKLGKTGEEIAQRMQYFTDKAFDNYMGASLIDEIYEVNYSTVRGKMQCPFAHRGLFRKGSVTLENKQNGIKLCWTPLNIHMIREHNFFEGEGSEHRLNPEDLVKGLF